MRQLILLLILLPIISGCSKTNKELYDEYDEMYRKELSGYSINEHYPQELKVVLQAYKEYGKSDTSKYLIGSTSGLFDSNSKAYVYNPLKEKRNTPYSRMVHLEPKEITMPDGTKFYSSRVMVSGDSTTGFDITRQYGSYKNGEWVEITDKETGKVLRRYE